MSASQVTAILCRIIGARVSEAVLRICGTITYQFSWPNTIQPLSRGVRHEEADVR